MKDIKFYKNPHRQNEAIRKPYVPAYQEFGLSPVEIAASNIASHKQLPNNALIVSSNPRTRPVSILNANVPFAEPSTLPITGNLPNVGNNMESTWVSVDGDEFYSDGHEIKSGLDPEFPMIDNNEDDPENYKDIPKNLQTAPAPVEMLDLDEQEVLTGESSSTSFNVGEHEYVIVVNESIVAIGPFNEIEKQVRELVFGQHEMNQRHTITVDDIIVLKRIKIKVGVFIE